MSAVAEAMTRIVLMHKLYGRRSPIYDSRYPLAWRIK